MKDAKAINDMHNPILVFIIHMTFTVTILVRAVPDQINPTDQADYAVRVLSLQKADLEKTQLGKDIFQVVGKHAQKLRVPSAEKSS